MQEGSRSVEEQDAQSTEPPTLSPEVLPQGTSKSWFPEPGFWELPSPGPGLIIHGTAWSGLPPGQEGDAQRGSCSRSCAWGGQSGGLGEAGVLWVSRQGLAELCPPACPSASSPSMNRVSSPTCGLPTARGKAPGSPRGAVPSRDPGHSAGSSDGAGRARIAHARPRSFSAHGEIEGLQARKGGTGQAGSWGGDKT